MASNILGGPLGLTSLRRVTMQAKSGNEPAKLIDAHLHVWASEKEARSTFPYFPGQEPTIEGNVELLVQKLAEANVAGALIVQPINHKFDHSYVSSVLQRYPGKFSGCCLANPDESGCGLDELDRLVTQDGYKAVRFNPYLWPSGHKMDDDVGRALFAKAGQLGVPVGFMCFKGLGLHINEIEHLCTQFPSTKVIIDHFGFCKPPQDEEQTAAWNSLLHLASYPQVHAKVSAFFRVSREAFPYRDLWPLLRKLVDTYGATRLMWGSDFPFVNDQCGYFNATRVLDLAAEEGTLSPTEVDWLMGGTVNSVFHGAWV